REITDGKSLHRRLAQPMVKDELGRLTETLNQMMTRLERSFAALRRFTAEASHELKTPLTVLRAGVERAITTPGVPQEALAALEETLQETNRMTELVDALLTLARADEGIAPLHKEAVDLRSIVAEAGETGELLAEQAGVQMEVRTPPEPVVVPVDRSRIRQLILNLLTNAVKYTPQGGRVQVQLGPGDDVHGHAARGAPRVTRPGRCGVATARVAPASLFCHHFVMRWPLAGEVPGGVLVGRYDWEAVPCSMC